MPWVAVAAFELWVHKKNKEICESTTCQRVTATLPHKDGLLTEPRATQPRGQTLLTPVPLRLTVLGRTDSGTPGPEAWTAPVPVVLHLDDGVCSCSLLQGASLRPAPSPPPQSLPPCLDSGDAGVWVAVGFCWALECEERSSAPRGNTTCGMCTCQG